MLQKFRSPTPSRSTGPAYLSLFLSAALPLLLGLGAPAPASAAEPDLTRSCARYASDGVRVAECVEQLRLAREASAKYHDPQVALRDGFVPSECHQHHHPGTGAMGEHWNRVDRMADDKLDPREPEQLLYIATPKGRKLLSAEWSVPALEGGLPHYGTEPPDPGRIPPPPQMFGGRSFNGPMQGHNLAQAWPYDVHLTPQPWHYDLHVWLWEENPDGIFAQYNRRVSCKDGVAPEGEGHSGSGSPRDRVRLGGCQDAYAPIQVPADEVRRYVPRIDGRRYRLFGEQLGTAVLAVRIFACDSVQVPGSRPRRTLGAQFGAIIESPDGSGRLFGSDACCNWYAFFWVTDNRALARWLTKGTALGGVVHHVKRLAYHYQAGSDSPTATIHFAANGRTPSPFELEATVGAPSDSGPGQEIAPNWWTQSRAGSIRIANHAPAFRPYTASGEVRTRPGTQMAALFHAETKSFGSPFSYGRWDRSLMTKGVFWPR